MQKKPQNKRAKKPANKTSGSKATKPAEPSAKQSATKKDGQPGTRKPSKTSKTSKTSTAVTAANLDTKSCSNCTKQLPLTDFYTQPGDNEHTVRYSARCRSCTNTIAAERRAADPDTHRERSRKAMERYNEKTGRGMAKTYQQALKELRDRYKDEFRMILEGIRGQ